MARLIVMLDTHVRIPLSLYEESGQKESGMQRENVIQILNDPLAQELLHSAIPARLAYTGRDGFPRVIPIGFYWNGTQFFVCTAPNAPKVRALAANPKVALTIDTDTFPPHVLLVRGTASIEVVDGIPPEYLEASQKGIEAEQRQAFEAQVRATYKQMARIAIVPEWAKLLDFETRIPSFLSELIH
jgi:Pyridoxamine 5'-phosphate oxidase